jgi:putative endonuclease
MSRTRALGAEGEALAAQLLEANGYTILARNARVERVEIDLVARRGSTLVFVEVKSRRSRAHGAPEEAVDERKRRRLVRGATAWLRAHGPTARRVRFDVIVCEPDAAGAWQLRHLEGAFDAGE